jgi:hypothetical protein
VAMYSPERTCGPWREEVRGVTDDDGQVRFSVPGPTTPGRHPFRLIVLGDRSYAEASVWALAAGTEAVVFDIDATLTIGDSEIVEQVLTGAPPPMRPGADQVARRWAALGYLPVYLTGRPRMLRQASAQWLQDHGFPPGPLIGADRWGEVLPTWDGVGDLKQRTLVDLERRGLSIVRAYGNASTDACAYARAGIAPERTYLVDVPRACPGFTPPQVIDGYVPHLETLDDVSPAEHPFPAP